MAVDLPRDLDRDALDDVVRGVLNTRGLANRPVLICAEIHFQKSIVIW